MPLDDNYEPVFGEVEKAITDKTKVIFLANPNNPTATICDDGALAEFIHHLPEQVAGVLKGRRAFGVIDRNVSFGWNTGIIYEEVCASMNRAAAFVPNIPFIAGLGGEDVTAEHINYAIDEIMTHAEDAVKHEAVWLNREDKGRW